MNAAQKLFNQIKTRQQGEEVLEVLHGGGGKKGFLGLSFPLKVSSGDLKSELAADFEKLFYGAKSVQVTLAFYPSEPIVGKIIDWFGDNLGEKVIVDLVVDPEIIGGAKVLCNEHFKDLTIRRKLDEMGIFKQESEEEQAAAAI